MKAVNNYGRELPVWDDGFGPLWLYQGSFGPVGVVRAQTFEDAWSCVVDEILPDADPNDPDSYARSYDPDADLDELAEGVHWRGSGVPSNPGLKSHLAQEDLNGSYLREVTHGELVTKYGVHVTYPPSPGAVSLGTLRSEDLIPTFMAELDEIDPAGKVDRDAMWEDTNKDDPEDIAWTLECLVVALDDLAPEGCYFGAQYGDGACFGFWPLVDWGEPCDGDYILSPCGSLGSRTSVCVTSVCVAGGKYVGMFDTEDEAIQAIARRMKSEGFWPNVWREDDHGGMLLINMGGETGGTK